MVSRVRAENIVKCFGDLEQASAKDWRASRERLSLLAPERFNDKRAEQHVQVSVDMNLAEVAKMLAQIFRPKQLSCGVQATTGSGGETKQIGYTPQDSQPIDVKAQVEQSK